MKDKILAIEWAEIERLLRRSKVNITMAKNWILWGFLPGRRIADKWLVMESDWLKFRNAVALRRGRRERLQADFVERVK